MTRKRAKPEHRRGRAAPKTFGELRKLLAELGNPWSPDPARSDDEPIPAYTTGGDGTREPVGELLPIRGVFAFLKRFPPSNTLLREVWRERGLLDESRIESKRRIKPRPPTGTG